jgi:hypothetical protein
VVEPAVVSVICVVTFWCSLPAMQCLPLSLSGAGDVGGGPCAFLGR